MYIIFHVFVMFLDSPNQTEHESKREHKCTQQIVCVF